MHQFISVASLLKVIYLCQLKENRNVSSSTFKESPSLLLVLAIYFATVIHTYKKNIFSSAPVSTLECNCTFLYVIRPRYMFAHTCLILWWTFKVLSCVRRFRQVQTGQKVNVYCTGVADACMAAKKMLDCLSPGSSDRGVATSEKWDSFPSSFDAAICDRGRSRVEFFSLLLFCRKVWVVSFWL